MDAPLLHFQHSSSEAFQLDELDVVLIARGYRRFPFRYSRKMSGK